MQKACPISIDDKNISGLILNVPTTINSKGNCNPRLTITGKNGPHNILGGLATAFNIISRTTITSPIKPQNQW